MCNPESLRIKRFLSNTRSYFKEGAWIRKHFEAFFPDIAIDSEGNLYYDLKTLNPGLSCLKAACLLDTGIPEELVELFRGVVDDFRRKIEGGGVSFNEQMSAREFTIPNPEKHPELFWLVEDKSGLRLMVLWGLESELPGGNIRLDVLPDRLFDLFTGRIALRSVPAFVDTSSGADAEMDSSPPPKSLQIHSEVSERLHSGHSQKEQTPRNSRDKNLVTSNVEVRVQEKTRRKPSVIGRCFRGLVFLLLLVIGVIEGSVWYLGNDVEFEAVEVENDGFRDGCFVSLNPGEILLLFNGTELRASDSKTTVSIDLFPKPGKYVNEVYSGSDRNESRRIEVSYLNERNDMELRPVACLLLDSGSVKVNTPVTASVFHSFHEQNAQTINYRISWGDDTEEFVSVTHPEEPIEHSYRAAGHYNVTLMVRDLDGKWDQDTCVIEVIDGDPVPVKGNLPPVTDVEIVSIMPVERTQEVVIDISHSFDPDGAVKQVWVDWGDGSVGQPITLPQTIASHRYKGGNNRINIRAIAEDVEGFKSNKPALLYVDFQSSELNSFHQKSERSKFEEFQSEIVAGEWDQLRMHKLVSVSTEKNKQPMRFDLRNPVNRTGEALLDVKWTLLAPNGQNYTVEDGHRVDVCISEGTYLLTVEARTLSGETLMMQHRFSSSLKDKMPVYIRGMDWIVRQFPYLNYNLFPGKN